MARLDRGLAARQGARLRHASRLLYRGRPAFVQMENQGIAGWEGTVAVLEEPNGSRPGAALHLTRRAVAANLAGGPRRRFTALFW
jgi:hypothetical protein